jgi:ureidoacrylate peracid hydrolase
MLQIQDGNTYLNFGLLVIDMQNGFVSKGGSYNKLGMNIKDYRKAIPTIKDLMPFVGNRKSPFFILKQLENEVGLIC